MRDEAWPAGVACINIGSTSYMAMKMELMHGDCTGKGKLGNVVASSSFADTYSKGKMPNFNDARTLTQLFARSVADIHEHQIVHGDIKLSNVLLRIDGDGTVGSGLHVALADFGKGRWLSKSKFSRSNKSPAEELWFHAQSCIPGVKPLTKDELTYLFGGTKLLHHPGPGTPGTRQPCHSKSEDPGSFPSSKAYKQYDFAGDVWSLGVMCYMVVTGKRHTKTDCKEWEQKLHKASQVGQDKSWLREFAEHDLSDSQALQTRFESQEGWGELFKVLEGMLRYDVNQRSTAQEAARSLSNLSSFH
jgi:serine/threonine protein kinase